MLLFSYGATAEDVSDSESSEYCCITSTGRCLGPHPEYGDTFNDLGYDREELRSRCLADGGTFNENACPELTQCVRGCCVFRSGSAWFAQHDVEQKSCSELYDESYFDTSLQTGESCQALLMTDNLEKYFNIVDGSGNQISINQDLSYLQKVGDSTVCSFVPFSSGNYNYGVDCDGSARLGFGTYFINIIAQRDGETYSYSENKPIYNEEIKEIVLRADTTDTVSIEGQIFQYELVGDDFVQQENPVVGAVITISGANVQNTSGTDGRFTLTNIPYNKKSPADRVLSVSAPGFTIYGQTLHQLDQDRILETIYLLPAAAGETSICCPLEFGGCKEDVAFSACYAGMGRTGERCLGTSASDACVLPAAFCCSSPMLCSPANRVAGGCSGSQGCSVPCMPEVRCTPDAEVRSACYCENKGNFVNSGYCCKLGEGDYVHSNEACGNIGKTVRGIVLGKGRHDSEYRPQSSANVLFGKRSEAVAFRTTTSQDGTFSVTLPEGSYDVNAFKAGFVPDGSRQIRIVDAAGFSHIMEQSPFKGDNNKDDDNKVLEKINTTLGPMNMPSFLDGEDFHHIIVLDNSVPGCDWSEAGRENTLSLNFARVEHVKGREELKLRWGIDDCLELSHFRIERKATMYINNKRFSDESDSDWIDIATVSGSRSEFTDTNVKWSELTRSYRGLPILRLVDPEYFDLNIETADELIRWEYEYRITPYFSNQGEGISSEILTATMGNSVCEGKYDQFTDEFCGYDQQATTYLIENFLEKTEYHNPAAKLQSLRTLRVRCDANNTIQWTQTISGASPQVCTRSTLDKQMDGGVQLAPTCFGPDGAGRTRCDARSPCGQLSLQRSGPFGMFHSLSLNNNFCYGPEIGTSGRYENACVLQPFRTTSDKCMYCEEVFDCSDYTSEQACGIDNCMVGNYNSGTGKSCEWINTSMKSVGEGVCIPASIRPSESFCHLADRDNLPFSVNLGWSDDFCSELGDCFSTITGGCRDCADIGNNCGRYQTREECTGSGPLSQAINISYPKPEDRLELSLEEWISEYGFTCAITEEEDNFYNRSNDGCGIGVCNWDADVGCFRDANSNQFIDSEEDQSVNPADIDNYPPTMTLENRNNIFSKNPERSLLRLRPNKPLYSSNFDTDFADNRFGFRYCIGREDNCCPHLPGSENGLDSIFHGDRIRVDITENNVVEEYGDGVYYFRYLAQDTNLNIAPLESIRIIVDTTPPKFEASVMEWAVSNQPGYVQLVFDLTSTGTDVASGTTEAISCEFRLSRLGRPTESGITLNSISPSSEGFFIAYNLDYTVPDGLYDFNIRCEDAAGNINDTYWSQPYMRIRADGQDNLNVINPPDGGAIPSFDNVGFVVQTEVNSTCWINWPNTETGEKIYQNLDTANGLDHSFEVFRLFDTSRKVFDDTTYENGYRVGCRELETLCSRAPRNVCEENSDDCPNGVCENRSIEQDITFVVDDKPPVTIFDVRGYNSDLMSFSDISERRRPDERQQTNLDTSFRYDGVYYFNSNVSITLNCEDTVIDELFSNLNAGCDASDVMYCTKALSNVADDRICNPDVEGQAYSGEIEQDDSFVICFYSTDRVGNEEVTRCRHFYIDDTPPELEFRVLTEMSRDNYYFVSDTDVMVEGIVLDTHIENFQVLMVEPDRRESVVLNFKDGLTNDFTTTTISGSPGGYNFVGPLKQLTSVNARGPNRLRLYAEDWFGNTNSKLIFLYYDTFPPFLGNYRINGVNNGKVADYDEDIVVSLFIDDVFWTNEVENVRVRVTSSTTSDFSTPYDSGLIEIDDFEIIGDVEITARNATDELVDFIRRMLAPDRRVDMREMIRLMEPYAQWKEFTFRLIPEKNPMTLLNDIGVGEYIINILAEDSFGQTMEESIIFNVTDPNPPQITLLSPQVVFSENEDDDDVRTVITNNINEMFVVETDVPAQCYFDLGDAPHRTNTMITDLSSGRQKHKYVLSGWTPFEGISPIPFVISCEKHGGDLVVERYTLLFDRRPMSLDVSLDRGNLVSEERGLQTHILEYSLDYSKRVVPTQHLSPNIVVEESSGKFISCRFTCSSANSVCPESQGTFSHGYFRRLHTKSFNFWETSSLPGMPYAFGDYMFEIFCSDQAGNEARAKDLVISIRDPRAPQKLNIITSGDSINPRNNRQFFLSTDEEQKNVTFTVATNMLTTCEIDFINRPLPNQQMSDEGSLNHVLSVELEPGNYIYRYVCRSVVQEQKTVTSGQYSFSVVSRGTDLGSNLMQQVRKQHTDLPIVRFLNLPSQYVSVEYTLNDEDFHNPMNSYNMDALILLESNPEDVLYVRFVDDVGSVSDVVNLELSSDTILPDTEEHIGGVSLLGDGSVSGSYADYDEVDGVRTYYARNRMVFPQIWVDQSIDNGSSVIAISNGDDLANVESVRLTSTSLLLGYNLDQGMNDVLIWIQTPDETNMFVRFNVNVNSEPPRILSVSPRFIETPDTQTLSVQLSEPAYCDIVYSPNEGNRQIVKHSRGASANHVFKLENIRIPFRRYDASQVSVVCRNRKDTATEYQHLMQVDVRNPRIRDVISDNSVRVRNSNTDYEFTVVRDEDLHIILHLDEYARCMYENEAGDKFKFADYYQNNLYPHTSLPASETQKSYTVFCKDEVDRRTIEDVTISVVRDADRDLFVHSQYPVGITNERMPEIEVYTFRDAECTIDVIDGTETPNLFFQVFDTIGSFFTPSRVMEKVAVGHRYRHFVRASSMPTYQMGLEPGRIYTAAVRCEAHGRHMGQIEGTETKFSFRYQSSGDPRPVISVN